MGTPQRQGRPIQEAGWGAHYTNQARKRAPRSSRAPSAFRFQSWELSIALHGRRTHTPLLFIPNPYRTRNFLHFVTPGGNLILGNACAQWVSKCRSHKEPAALYLKRPLHKTCCTFFWEKQNRQESPGHRIQHHLQNHKHQYSLSIVLRRTTRALETRSRTLHGYNHRDWNFKDMLSRNRTSSGF